MKQKQVIFIIKDSNELSEKIQLFLFENGYEWNNSENKVFNKNPIISYGDETACICIGDKSSPEKTMCYAHIKLFQTSSEYKDFLFFDVESQWDQILQFFDKEIEIPNIYFKGRGYKI